MQTVPGVLRYRNVHSEHPVQPILGDFALWLNLAAADTSQCAEKLAGCARPCFCSDSKSQFTAIAAVHEHDRQQLPAPPTKLYLRRLFDGLAFNTTAYSTVAIVKAPIHAASECSNEHAGRLLPIRVNLRR